MVGRIRVRTDDWSVWRADSAALAGWWVGRTRGGLRFNLARTLANQRAEIHLMTGIQRSVRADFLHNAFRWIFPPLYPLQRLSEENVPIRTPAAREAPANDCESWVHALPPHLARTICCCRTLQEAVFMLKTNWPRRCRSTVLL